MLLKSVGRLPQRRRRSQIRRVLAPELRRLLQCRIVLSVRQVVMQSSTGKYILMDEPPGTVAAGGLPDQLGGSLARRTSPKDSTKH
mmetsp:Transcript_61310/g.164305  ORF Transcript_61310/g.164305 Transcript_61310/m.164305 type:complete len:86 (-) Transcript_61310:23-280(-)